MPARREVRHRLSLRLRRSSTTLFEDAPFDYVYHLAAYAAEGLSHFIRRFNYTNNVIGSVNLINGAVRTDVGSASSSRARSPSTARASCR